MLRQNLRCEQTWVLGTPCKKIHFVFYRVYTKSNEQFTWRAAKTRLFNNVAILLRTEDEADEYVQAIGEQIRVTVTLTGKLINLTSVPILSIPGRIDKNRYLSEYPFFNGIPLDSSFSQTLCRRIQITALQRLINIIVIVTAVTATPQVSSSSP